MHDGLQRDLRDAELRKYPGEAKEESQGCFAVTMSSSEHEDVRNMQRDEQCDLE